MKLSRRGYIGLIVAAAGTLIFFAGNYRSWGYGFSPLNVPLPIRTGVYKYHFTPGFAATYEVQVVAERKLEPELLDCLLYTRKLWQHRKGCTEKQESLRALWEVLEGARSYASGESDRDGSIGLSQNSDRGTPEGDREATVIIRRGMGTFTANALHTYDLKLTMLTDSSQLEPANPRLQIQMYLADRYRIQAFAVMASLVAILCAVICFTLVSGDLLRNTRFEVLHTIAALGTSLFGGIVAVVVGHTCIIWTLVALYPGSFDIDVGLTGEDMFRRYALSFLLVVVPVAIITFIMLRRILRIRPDSQVAK